MNLCCDSEVTVNLGTFSVDYCDSQACSLRFVLCEIGICVIGLEVLDLLEVRFLQRGPHSCVKCTLEILEGTEKFKRRITVHGVVRGAQLWLDGCPPFVQRRIGATIVVSQQSCRAWDFEN